MDNFEKEKAPALNEDVNPALTQQLDNMEMYFAIQGTPSDEVRERETQQYNDLMTRDISLMVPSILFSNDAQWREDPGYYRAAARAVRDKLNEPT